jgi:hypothetical protein
MDQKASSSRAKLVLMLMGDGADAAGDYSTGLPYLAKHAECSEEAVQAALDRLQAKRLIKQGPDRVRRPDGVAVVIHLLMPD